MIGVDGKGLTDLTNESASSEYAPQWSPDGKRIAFTHDACERPSESGPCVWVMNADGSGKTNLTPEDLRSECPAFAPGNSHRNHSAEPTWSPDGRMIAFTGHYDICVDDPAVNSSDIWVMNADGSGKRDLTSADKTVDRQPTWSPDGTGIAFVREPADRSDAELFRIPVIGGAATQITNNSEPDEDPDWGRAAPPCVVPKVTGKTLARARRAILKADCRLGKVTKKRSSKKRGTVIKQRPAAGKRAVSGAKVSVTVAKR